MVESILDDLSKDDLTTRLGAIDRFESLKLARACHPILFAKAAECPMREVRAAAAKRLGMYPPAFETFLHDLDPQVQIIAIEKSVSIRPSHKDPVQVLTLLTDRTFLKKSPTEIRCAVARVLADHARSGPVELVIDKIIPVIDALICDNNDNVRVATALNVKELAKIFGLEFIFGNCRAALQVMLTDSQWRLRNSAIEVLFELAMVVNHEYFDAQMFDLLLGFLRDPCDAVRQFTLSGLPGLVERFGGEWLQTKLVQNLGQLAVSNNFLHRQTYLLAIASLTSFFPEKYQSNFVFQPMIRMLNDDVYNVVEVALILLSERLGEIHPFRRQYELAPILDSLAADAPQTVKELARALINQFV
jgi:HEAT repeat protein